MFCRIFCIFLFCFSAFADSQEISLSVGEAKSRYFFPDRGELTSDTFRLGLIHTTDYAWKFFSNQTLKLELEAGVHRWQDVFLKDDKTGAYVNPMWRYYLELGNFQPYLGFGIGISYTDDDRFMDRKLGSRLLFEDRFEAGVIFYDSHRLSFSVNHYSNANLADINHGVNIYYINYAYRL